MDEGVDEGSPRAEYDEPDQSHEPGLDYGQEPGDRGDQGDAAAAVAGEDSGVEAAGDQDTNRDGDDTTAKKRKKDRRYLQQQANRNGASRKLPPARRSLTRSMSEWQETCKRLGLPTESQSFCDYVLVFDEIVQEDINEAKNKHGCCVCCRTSYKELEECLKVACNRRRRRRGGTCFPKIQEKICFGQIRAFFWQKSCKIREF